MEHQVITGFILAGGRSTRMGTDKSLLLFQGKPLIQHAIDIIKPLCQEVIISANEHKYDFTGCRVLPDELPQQAPIVGILSCLKQSGTNLNIFLSCDMPRITTSLFRYMMLDAANYDIIVPLNNKYLEPLCGIYRKSVIPAMEKFIGSKNFKLHEFIRNTNHLPLEIPSNKFRSDIFMNINTPEDLKMLTS